jgi:hypothetical protein
MRSRRLATFALCALVGVPLLSQDQMRPGRWKVTTQSNVGVGSRMPLKIPAAKNARCVTPALARTPVDAISTITGHNKDCRISDYKGDGNTLTWKISCANGVNPATTGDGEMVFNGDGFTAKVSLIVPPGTVGSRIPDSPNHITQYTGTRIGDCQ